MKGGKHGHTLRTRRFAQSSAINGRGNAERQYVKHQANHHLARPDGDIHPGQQQVKQDAGEQRHEHTHPKHAGCIIGEEARQGPQEDCALNTNIQHPGTLRERLPQGGK